MYLVALLATGWAIRDLQERNHTNKLEVFYILHISRDRHTFVAGDFEVEIVIL